MKKKWRSNNDHKQAVYYCMAAENAFCSHYFVIYFATI